MAELGIEPTWWWQKGLASRIDQMWYLEPKWLRYLIWSNPKLLIYLVYRLDEKYAGSTIRWIQDHCGAQLAHEYLAVLRAKRWPRIGLEPSGSELNTKRPCETH